MLVMKEPINFSNIWMLQIVLNFDFSNKLSQEILLNDFFFLYNFQSYNKSTFFLYCQKYTTKFSLS